MAKGKGGLAVDLARYSLATIGPVGSAGTQFLLSFVLLHSLDASAFGSFSFLLITAQFSWGIWSALFCAPLPALLAARTAHAHGALLRCLFTANMAGVVIAFMVFVLLGVASGATVKASCLFAAYAAVALLRWFARAHAYATEGPIKAMASDLLYSAVLLVGVVLIALGRTATTIDLAYGLLLAGAVVGLLPFGRAYLIDQFLRGSRSDLRGYAGIWNQHSGWSLLGVLTSEATANAHVYIVTFLYGPLVFAPIAASGLLIRPINVAMNALTEFERARMARQIGEGKKASALASVHLFRLVLIAIWVAVAIAILMLLYYAPGLIAPPQYDFSLLVTGMALWMVVAMARLVRVPEGTLLQAAGAFRALAFASVASAVLSILAVIGLVSISGALWSIAGIALGEFVCAIWTWRQARTWRMSAPTDRGVR